MSHLFGTFENLSVDDKGRFSIPASLRSALSPQDENTFMIVRGTEGCLFAYPKTEWLKFWDKLNLLPTTQETTRLKNRILASLKETRLDAQGRVTLTQKLKDLAEIGSEMVVVGAGEKLNIWNMEIWNRQQAMAEESKSYDSDYYHVLNETSRNGHGG